MAGGKLEVILYRLSNTPLKGVLLGTGVTAIIQSSSATSVMVVGFVNAGMIKMKQAIGIIMGAIIGTSVTGWVLCLSDISGGAGWVDLLSTEVLAAGWCTGYPVSDSFPQIFRQRYARQISFPRSNRYHTGAGVRRKERQPGQTAVDGGNDRWIV